MTHFPQTHPQQRAQRIQFNSLITALIQSDGGQRAKGRLYIVSMTGGLLRLAKALSDGDFVEVAFQTASGPVHGMAEMLPPTRRATDGVMQPFRFIALGDDDHRVLRMAVDSIADRTFVGLRSSQWSLPKGQ
jgi:hypothetical protein